MHSDSSNSAKAAVVLAYGLIDQDVTHIFGIPGGKIMPAFDAFNDVPDGLQLIVCGHEQNAVFMSGAIARLMGCPSICMVTSGPRTVNLLTGAATATSEGDPTVALCGVVPPVSLKHAHNLHKQKVNVTPLEDRVIN